MRKAAFVAAILLLALSWRSLGDSQVPPVSATVSPTEPAAPPAVPVKSHKAVDKLPAFTPEREAAALAFVTANHPDLTKVLDQLRATQPKEYQAAVRDLFATSERLSKIREQDPRRYTLELEQWNTKSRIQLLLARASLSDGISVEQPLREALAVQADLRLAQLELQRLQMAERLEKLDRDLVRARDARDHEVQKQYNALMGGVKKARAAQRKQEASAKTQDAGGKVKDETH